MIDAQSTIVGLKAQDCPGGGWNGMPTDLERATVADCLAHGACGCIYGDAVQHIERLRRELNLLKAVHESAEAEIRRLAGMALEFYTKAQPLAYNPDGTPKTLRQLLDAAVARRALEGK